MNHREELGQRLKDLREKKGLSLREMSERTGIHFSNIGKIEKGKYNVGIDLIKKICDVLECTIEIKAAE